MDTDANNETRREVNFTYEELLQQNRSLSEELTQCRADKDFVWTMWKRLQAEKPDVASAVSMVIAREQEKAETKDKKVLAILKEKDNNIKILEEIAADLETQLKQSMERLSGLLVEQTDWEGKMSDLQRTVEKLKEEQEYQQEVMKAREAQSEKQQQTNIAEIESLETRKKELEGRVADLEGEVDKLTKEISTTATVLEANEVLRDKIKVLEKDLELTKREHDEKITSLRARETQLLAETAVVNDQSEILEQKDAEISALRSESKKRKLDYEECLAHFQEQNVIIKNLQLLQSETQEVMQNQQDSHKAEVKSYKITLNDMRMKCLDLQSKNEKLYGNTEALQQSLTDRQKESFTKDAEIADLRRSIVETSRRNEGLDSETQTIDLDCSRCRDLEEKLEDVNEELDRMKDIVHDRSRRISSLEKVLGERRRKHLAEREAHSDLDAENSDAAEMKSALEANVRNLEREIEDLDALLSLKDNELEETKKAHNRRLHRYKTLRENYLMVNQQLRTFEQDEPRKALNDIEIRADPKSLQHENSDSVWNELTFFRKQYQILKKEREDFEEEIDNLRVKVAENMAANKQLKLRLHQEQDESLHLRTEMKSKDKFVSPSKLYSMETQVDIWRKKAKDSELKIATLSAENESHKQRERYYKQEIIQLTDEIDNVHKNIKEKIDAEVQASDVMYTIEREANRPLDGTADSLARRDRSVVEQMIQTSPISPFKRRSPMRPISQSTQTTHTMETQTSSDDENIPHYITKDNRPKSERINRRRGVRKEDILSLDDLRTPGKRKMKDEQKHSPGRVNKKKKLPPRSSPAAREQSSLKLRILSLQQQVEILRSAKIKLTNELHEKAETNEVLKGELLTANRKIDSNRSSVQRLSDELERCSRDREELERELERDRKKTKAPEIGFKEMENRWKLATTECSKLSFQVKTLRGENDMMTARQREFQERILRLERQLNQKKQMLEDLREKLKDANQAISKETENLEDVKKKNKALILKDEQQKQYVENLRSKINQMTMEKMTVQGKLHECQEELKRKSRLLQQSQDLCGHAEQAVSEMEKAAFDQLHEQASSQETLHLKIREELSKEQKRIKEYQLLLKGFVESLLKDGHRLRVLISERRRQRKEEEKRKRNEKESMIEARDIACSILDMSSEDLDALMEDDDHEATLIDTNDNDMRERLEEYIGRENKFAKMLLKLLLELLDQNWKLRMQENDELNQLKELKQAS